MKHRLASGLTIAAVASIAASVLTPAASAAPPPSVPPGWCTTPTETSCVVSVMRDDAPLADPSHYSYTAITEPEGAGGTKLQWSISDPSQGVPDSKTGETYESLAATETSHVWSITVRVAFVPRQTDTYADNVSVVRSPDSGTVWDVTTSGNPVVMGVNAECHPDCPQTSGAHTTTFQGEFRNFQFWDDSSQWPDFMGMDSWTNVEESDVPPQVIGDPFTIKVDLANSHMLDGASTPFQGFFHQVIPNQFLIDMGIDDPSTLTPSGVSASIGSGSSVVTPGANSTEVDTTGITFSPRVLRLKTGVITPTKPRSLVAKRISAHRAKLTFHRAKPRGSRLVGYHGRCLAKHHTTVKASGKRTTLRLRGLAKGIAYSCQVRAKSKAGYGHWSKKKHLKAS